jgi:hypothetical protein
VRCNRREELVRPDHADGEEYAKPR